MRSALLGLFLAFTLAACAPHIESAGPPVREAAMADEYFIMPDGFELPYRLWKPADGAKPKAIILALHGFNDYSNSYADPAPVWAEQGIWTYAYDQRGFGATASRGYWPGGPTLRDDLREVTHLLRKKHPGAPLVLLGESMGSAVILTAATEDPAPDADRIILSAPAVWGRQEFPWYHEGPAWVIVHLIPWAKIQPRTKLRPSDNIEMLRALGRDPLVIKKTRLDSAWGLLNLMTEAQTAAPRLALPALILYGNNEELIPKGSKERFLDLLPEGPDRTWSLIEYDQGFHMLMRDLNADIVWRDIADYSLNGARDPAPDGGETAISPAPSPDRE